MALIIIIKVFLKCKLLSLETILSVLTHTHKLLLSCLINKHTSYMLRLYNLADQNSINKRATSKGLNLHFDFQQKST